MTTIRLDRRQYRDKVYACWLGKTIGGTLGAPHECKPYALNLTYYTPVPDAPLPNDDLDFQLVWLRMLEEHGPAVSLPRLAEYWRRYLIAWPPGEYGFCARNLQRGLLPPVSGWFENDWVDEMGSPIRSEIWACMAPANPQRAAALAWMDSALDHSGGEGMYGEMFWAAVQSAAFVLDDPLELIRIGLAMIPPSCRVARAIREVLFTWQHPGNWGGWGDARHHVIREYGSQHPCHAVQNIAFTVIGLLYGTDFSSRLLNAVNCGFDTDCTGATLGALLGIMQGTAGIPAHWQAPIGTSIVLCSATVDCGLPKSIDELTERTVAMAERFAAADTGVHFGDGTILPAELGVQLMQAEEARRALAQDLRTAVMVDRDLEITWHYESDPVIRPGVPQRAVVTCRQAGQPVDATITLTAPTGWQVTSYGDGAFVLTAPTVEEQNTIEVVVSHAGEVYHAHALLLSPQAADGYPAGEAAGNFCPQCTGRGGWCLCPKTAVL